jgi:hypothetical protein
MRSSILMLSWLPWLTFRNYTHSEPRFRALLHSDGARDVRFTTQDSLISS